MTEGNMELYVALLAIVFRNLKVSLHQLNSKHIGPVLHSAGKIYGLSITILDIEIKKPS